MVSRLQKLKIVLGFMVFTFIFGMRIHMNVQDNEEKIKKYTLTVEDSITNSNEAKSENSSYIRKGKVVIILSNQRSGSSFVGDFFAHNNKGFYLYEPLHPFGMTCDKLNIERLNLLKNIAQCDFREMRSSYRNAFEVSEVKSHRECLVVNLCSPPRHNSQLHRYSSMCRTMLGHNEHSIDKTYGKGVLGFTQPCSYPLNLTIWSSMCHSADLVAFKVLRICSLKSLENITMELEKLGNEVYVIELVRDPRGIVNSALKLQLRKNKIDERLDQVCGKYEENIKYSEKEMKDNKMISKYIRIRYEDIASDPVNGARYIYSCILLCLMKLDYDLTKACKHTYKFVNFLGMKLPIEVKNWIESSTTNVDKKIDNLRHKLENNTVLKEEQNRIVQKMTGILNAKDGPYSTIRDSNAVIVKWRKSLSMVIITQIQNKCSYVMNKLGYKTVRNAEERNNLTNQLW